MGLLTGIRSRKRARKVHGGENFRTLPQRDSFNTTTTHATITASGSFTTPTLTIEPGSTGMVITNDEMARQGQRVTGMHIPCKVHSLQRCSRRLNERKLFRRTPLSSSFLLYLSPGLHYVQFLDFRAIERSCPLCWLVSSNPAFLIEPGASQQAM